MDSNDELELTPLVESSSSEKLVPRICRIPTRLIELADGTSSNINIINSESRENVKVIIGKLEDSLPRFGPVYRVHQPSVEATKEKAWEHVLKMSIQKDPSVKEEERKEQEEEIKDIYSTTIRLVEQEARDIYGHNSSEDRRSSFRWMLIKDGCFFLQLALLILGCSEQLGYPRNDPIFGKKLKKKDVQKWIEAMFYVGNQIPLVVIHELMNQSFFQDVIKKATWYVPQSSLCQKVLYEVLVLPSLRRNQGLSLKERIKGKGNSVVDQHPSDLLHGLQNLIMGPDPLGNLSPEYDADDQIDLEANEEEVGDNERIFPTTLDHINDEGTDSRIRILLDAIGLSSVADDRRRIFSCATEMKQAGIHIKKLKSGGVRSIYFKSYYFWAYLYLPVFTVDDNTETILGNLKTYEISQKYRVNRGEVCSYLRVMSDIIQTTRDAKLLEKEGIVQGSSYDYVEKLPRILSRLSAEDIRLTHEFRILRRKIRNYSSPLIHYKGVINLVVFLTMLQTLFALLAYFRPPRA